MLQLMADVGVSHVVLAFQTCEFSEAPTQILEGVGSWGVCPQDGSAKLCTSKAKIH